MQIEVKTKKAKRYTKVIKDNVDFDSLIRIITHYLNVPDSIITIKMDTILNNQARLPFVEDAVGGKNVFRKGA